MKRYCAFLLLFIVAFSALTPLLGAKTAQAQQGRNPKEKTDYVELSDIFKDRQNGSNAGEFWVGPESGKVEHSDANIYKTTAKLSAKLSLSDIYSAAEDDNPNGYVDSEDYLGGWLSVLKRSKITFPDVDKEHGIFLELMEVPKGEIKSEEDLISSFERATMQWPWYCPFSILVK